MTTFKQFSDQAVSASPLLSDAEIAILLRDNLHEPLQRYLFRIAVYAVNEIMLAEDGCRDDADYIDAALAALQSSDAVLRAERKYKLSTYAQATFRREALQFLLVNEKGGMVGDNHHEVPPVDVCGLEDTLPKTDEDVDDTESTWHDYTGYDRPPPMGYGDPLDELIRQETAEAAIKTANNRTATKSEAKRLSHEIGRQNK